MNTEFTLTDYLRVISRRKWIVLSALALTLLSTVFYTRLRPAVYRAQTTIRIQPSEAYARSG